MTKLVVSLIALVFFYGGSLYAQVSNATVTGSVTDTSKAIIPGVRVTLINEGTNIQYSRATNEAGSYYVSDLPAGSYRIEVEKIGFETVIKPDVVLHVQDALEINFEMAVGSVSQTVTVQSGAPSVELSTSAISGVVNSNTVLELPLNGRDWTQLATLQPGVNGIPTQQASGTNANRGNRGYGSELSISGTRPQTNNYLLDGISIVDYAGGSPGSVLGIALGVDAVGEFSVMTAGNSAEFGRTSGGVVNAITRTGTNQFHGDAYWFLRDSKLDAKNYFDALRPAPFHRNQFGGAVGGPIQEGKTFFFVDYEGLRQDLGTTQVDNVPSMDARNGIIHNANGTTTTITVSRLVAPYLGLYALPNAGLIGVGNTGHFDVSLNALSKENFETLRIDRKISETDSIGGTYFYDSGLTQAPDKLNTVLVGNTSERQMIGAQETHIFSSSLVNSVRGGFSRVVTLTSQSLKAINPLAGETSLGTYPGFFAPQISVSGLTSFAGGLDGLTVLHHNWNSFQGYDDVVYTKGVHSLKFGFVVERMQHNMLAPSKPDGVFSFGSLTNFLTDQPTTFIGLVPGTFQRTGARQTLFGGYAQDDWRIRPNLTLNLGVRYEMVTVPTETHNKLENLRTLTAPYPGVLGSPYFSNPTLRNFEPRVGFAWDPFHNGKTSVRGSFGMFDDLPLNYEFIFGEDSSAPFADIITLSNLAPNSFPTAVANSTTVNPSQFQVFFAEPNPPRNYVMIYNLDIQREIVPSTSVSIGYVGSRGVHMLNRADDVNLVLPTFTPYGYLWPFPAGSGTRLNPTVGDIRGLFWDGSSFYDALQARMTKKMSAGFQLEASYTWGKSIDTGSASVIGDPFTNSISSPVWFCTTCRRGLSDFNIGQTLVINYLWLAPTPNNWGAVASHVLGGWELGGIITLESGVPFTPRIGGDPLGMNSNDPQAFPDRLFTSGCASPINAGDPSNYVKLNCFALPALPSSAPASVRAQCTPFAAAPGTCSNLYGNVQRNSVIGPGLMDWDFSAVKNNYIRQVSEAFNIQFRAELFNVLNRANFAVPTDNQTFFDVNGNSVGGAGAVDLTSTTSRQIQFAIKVIW